MVLSSTSSRDRRDGSNNRKARFNSKERREGSRSRRAHYGSNGGRRNDNRNGDRRDEHNSSRRGSGEYFDEDVKVNFTENEDEVFINCCEANNIFILDSAATKSVSGKEAMENILRLVDEETKEKVEERCEKRNFKFGNQTKYPSLKEVVLPIKIGGLVSKIYISVVDTNIPLLLGRSDMA